MPDRRASSRGPRALAAPSQGLAPHDRRARSRTILSAEKPLERALESSLRNQLLDRRGRLEGAIAEAGEESGLVRLLQEVDSALKRMDARIYGFCEVCKETVDDPFLQANPLIQYCLCSLTPEKQKALERDLDLAARLQWALLPQQNVVFGGWEVHYRYEPAGPVSGDYCDLVSRENGEKELFFLVGDVSGKGVAASFLMARLNALFRTLLETHLPLDRLVERANRLFTEAAISSHYATLVCGRAGESGQVEVCNAGHCPPLVVRGDEVGTVDATGFPVGIFGDTPYKVHSVRMAPGDSLVLYSDGLTESLDPEGVEYGSSRLGQFLLDNGGLGPSALATACLRDLTAHQRGTPRTDDLTLMVVRRTDAPPRQSEAERGRNP